MIDELRLIRFWGISLLKLQHAVGDSTRGSPAAGLAPTRRAFPCRTGSLPLEVYTAKNSLYSSTKIAQIRESAEACVVVGHNVGASRSRLEASSASSWTHTSEEAAQVASH